MIVKDVHLINYRSYTDKIVNFSQGINILIGENAQGKTNLLESIYLSSIGKSFRTSNEKDLIKNGEEKAKIFLNSFSNKGNVSVYIELDRNNKKYVKLNEFNLTKLSGLIGNLRCVFFSPNELKLVKEAPEDRRKFMNIDLSQLDRQYMFSLMKYNRILNQRNKLLKMYDDKDKVIETLPIWNVQLAKTGAEIIYNRLNFINKINKYIAQIHSYITSDKENLVVKYSSLDEYDNKTVEEIEQLLLKQYSESVEKDLNLKYTTVGPHHDDLKFMLNELDAKSFASQGQQRTVALSLKIAELEIFKNATGEYPILLLDDVFSELDINRKQKLLDILRNKQTIITTTTFENELSKDGINFIEIKNN